MVHTNAQNVIETKAEGLTVKTVAKKKTQDGTSEFVQVFFNYDHPREGGKIRGAANFKIHNVAHNRGMNRTERGKITAPTIFNDESIIAEKKRTQKTGYVRKENVKDPRVGQSEARVLRSLELKTKPKDDDVTIQTLEKGDFVTVLDVSDDEEWYYVAAGGSSGFFETIYMRLAELLAEKETRKAAGLGNLSRDEIFDRMMANNVIKWPEDDSKGYKPTCYYKVQYFPPRNPGDEVRHAKYSVVGLDECLSLETMEASSLGIESMIINLYNVYIGGGKIIPQYYISSAVVNDIKKIERPNELQEDLDRLGQNKELVEKLRRQLEESKSFTPAEAPADPSAGGVEKESDTNQPSLQDMLDGGPVMDNDGIPGLPEL